MSGSDDDLGRDLKEAYGHDLPGDEFDARVMEAVEEGGGEHELSAEPVRSRRFVSLAALLAASVIFLLGYAVAGGFVRGSGSGTGEGEDDWDLAGGGGRKVDLPVAATAGPIDRPLKITVNAEGQVYAGGERVGFRELKKYLIEGTRGTHASFAAARPSTRGVILRADRRLRWQVVSWVLQACADPDVRLWKIYWAAVPEDELM